MVCRVLGLRNAADLTRPHLTKANVGPKKGNPDGHQQTVFQRFWLRQALKYKILLSISKPQNPQTIFEVRAFLPLKALVRYIRAFLLDKFICIYYAKNMLAGIRIYTSDIVWRQIFSDLNATVVDSSFSADLNFDDIAPKKPLTPIELKSLILSEIDTSELLRGIFGHDVFLSRIQTQIIVLLHRNQGLTAVQLKQALGYPSDIATNSIDTAIYQLRKKYGRNFIENDGGVYKLGRI